MVKKVETGLIIVKDDIFTKIRKSIFAAFFKEENELMKKMYEIEKPRNIITDKIVIPKEIKKLL